LRLTKVSTLALGLLLLIAGCSTTNHAPLPGMAYHDITGHYNAYFNANEKLKSIYATLDKTHKDNYKDIISLYTYGDPKDGSSVSGDADDIEKRLTKSIQIHKVSNWADDDFLLMGKALYIKGDYLRAQNFFKYVTTEYKNGVDYVKEMKKMGKVAKPTKKKKPAKKAKFQQVLDEKGNLTLKKIDERPSYSVWVHEPARAEGLIWLSRTYAAQKMFSEASAIIQYIKSDDKFYKNLDRYVEIADAEIYIRQKNYKDAILPLEKFVGMTKSKKQRVRPLFILAQINEQLGNYAKASDYYKEVLKNRPNYEMEFYAKIRRARMGKKGGQSDEIKKLLAQMSHDGKYRDFLDQIYYQLGEIALSENNRPEARKYFHKSISNSTKNPDQKAQAYIQLGKMDFEEEIYVSSKFFYDTALIGLSKTDSTYEPTQTRDKTLDKLVTQINIISIEDSLQRIAKMSPADRKRFLSKLASLKQKEEDEKQADKDRSKSIALSDFMKPAGTIGTSATIPGGDEASTFYFYNPNARSSGYNEFIRRWGSRKLEENWRRKDKSAVTADNTSETDSTGKSKQNGKDSTDNASQSSEDEKLLAAVPMTTEKLEKSNTKLVEAYYALGTVYKDDLQSYTKAYNTFEELNRRFPKNKLELESFYQLYLIYEKTKNTTKAENYKSLILSNYPNSSIAKYLTDPSYLAEAKKKENSLSTYYESAYNDYASGLYASAQKKCAEADVQFKENKLKAKFDMLNAMILAKENHLGDYIQSLNRVISKYPGTPEKDQAQFMLDKLNHSKLPQVDISKLPKDSTGAVIMPEITPQLTAQALSDTAGQADFLRKVQHKPAPKPAADTTGKPATVSAKDSTATSKAKPYKPLSRTERLDSIMKAEKAAKNNPAPAATDTKPANATTPPASDKPYKPLSRTERMDSIMKAEKAAKNKPAAANSAPGSAPTAPSSPVSDYSATPAADATPAPVATDASTANAKPYKPLSRTERMDSIMKAEKAAKNAPATISKPDTASKKNNATPKSTPKDTLAKKVITTAKDSLAKKAVNTNVKPLAKDSVVKRPPIPATKPAAKDTVSKKATAKETAKPKATAKDTVPTKPTAPKPVAGGPRPAFDADSLSNIYGKSDNAPHYVLFYFLDPTAYDATIASKLDSFDSASFAGDKLTTKAVVIDKDNKLIYVKGLTDKTKAQSYIAALKASLGSVTNGINTERYFLGSISMLNYSTLVSTKKINNYMRFHRINYK